MTQNTAYNQLSIHGKINARDHRNALNINYLFSTTLSGYTEKDSKKTEHPRRPAQNWIKWGIYHK